MALNLNYLAQWCMVGALGLGLLWSLMLMAGVYLNFLTMLAGLAGLASWGCAIVGTCYLFGLGSTKGAASGLGIATAAVSILHFFVMFAVFTNQGGAPSGVRFGPGGYELERGLNWNAMVTQFPTVTDQLGWILQTGHGFNSVGMVLGLLELARLIVFMFFVKAVAQEMRDSTAGKTATTVMIVVPAAIGVVAVLRIIMAEVFRGGSGEAMSVLFTIVSLGFQAAIIAICIFISMGLKAAVDAIDYRR